ncbi:hypothetical protein SDC9_97626 [bioreactor metagenome]|uniref:Uncharacterized protein n=1 Tax=bioreactor metagenome TaxID=1076179 RepID=A0A645ACJ7_9ZZZZ
MAVIQRFDLIGRRDDAVYMGAHLLKPADEAGLVLYLLHDGLRPDNHVPNALTGDPRVFRDLRQGEVIIIIVVEEFLLPVSEKFPIKIVEHGHAVGLIFQSKLPLTEYL